MTSSITPGIRKKLTTIDAAALMDLGWELIAPPGLAGDYNNDGTVNAADYTVWRNTRGQTGTGLAADGNFDKVIDPEDYTIWKSNFGQRGAGSGAAASAPVPEPSGFVLLICGELVFFRRPSAACLRR